MERSHTMSNDIDQTQGIDPEDGALDPHIREALRGVNDLRREKAEADERAARLERELAFTKAGIPDTPLTEALAKTYEGPNDAEAIKAYFTELGVESSASQPAPAAPAPDADLEAQRRLAQVGAAATGDAPVEYMDALKSAKTRDEVLAIIASAPAEAGIGSKVIQ